MEMFFAIRDGESQKKLFLQKNIRKLLRKNVPFAKNVLRWILENFQVCKIGFTETAK